jgi:acetoin utilization deacetylase AcuC-like enzyme
VKIIHDESCVSYHKRGHPERPQRVTKTIEVLRGQTDLKIDWAKPRAVEESSILRAHTSQFLKRLETPADFDADTAYFPEIPKLARQSVGAALEALDCARKGETAFGLMRPPGHHATRDKIMGFCYLNNIAIAALEALATGTERVAILDFDVHHGNGTEDILLNKSGAAFFSIHQFPCYPGTGGTNVGNNCFNFPVAPMTVRNEYRKVFERAFEQLKKFKPNLVGISAGFDAYARDPLAQETLEAEDFHWLGEQVRALQVPSFSLLEGGYSSDLPGLIFAYLRGLEGK